MSRSLAILLLLALLAPGARPSDLLIVLGNWS